VDLFTQVFGAIGLAASIAAGTFWVCDLIHTRRSRRRRQARVCDEHDGSTMWRCYAVVLQSQHGAAVAVDESPLGSLEQAKKILLDAEIDLDSAPIGILIVPDDLRCQGLARLDVRGRNGWTQAFNTVAEFERTRGA
jgi:hypothetical protein